MFGMLLTPAVEADYPEIVALANWAYRGTDPTASWNTEAGVLEGQRLTESLIREDRVNKPQGQLLTYRETGGVLMGTVWLEPKGDGAWYLGLLMVRPDRQNQQLGRTVLAAAEEFARERGARRIRMAVLHVRDPLIAWYERRGYSRNGETEPFPYGDERFGRPLRDDLHFAILEKVIERDAFLD
jgi:ribosomal protein S18 acetylase RimI-like enzyme